MKKIGKYKFDEVGEKEFINPDFIIREVYDNIITKNCSVGVYVEDYGILLDGFTYTDTWVDLDIEAWVDVKLNEYLT
jgi:hypothetical protein